MVSGYPDALTALPPGKEPQVPIGEEAGWASRAGLDFTEKRKIPIPGIEP
jgi:hypothetical protein